MLQENKCFPDYCTSARKMWINRFGFSHSSLLSYSSLFIFSLIPMLGMCISIHAVCSMNFCPKEGVPWSPQVIFERSLWDSLGISDHEVTKFMGHEVPGPSGTCTLLLLENRTWGQLRHWCWPWQVFPRGATVTGCLLVEAKLWWKERSSVKPSPVSAQPWHQLPQSSSGSPEVFLLFLISSQLSFSSTVCSNPTWRGYWGKGNILKINIWWPRFPVVLEFF